MSTEVQFRDVDLKHDAQTAIDYCRETFLVSFSNLENFNRDCGEDGSRLKEWIARRMEQIPGSCVHVWHGDLIIGQIFMGVYKPEPEYGYVNQYYLIPEYRGRGYGNMMDDYACRFLRAKGHVKARLCVSPTNERAVAFYKKAGWVSIGQRPGRPEALLMEKPLEAAGSP